MSVCSVMTRHAKFSRRDFSSLEIFHKTIETNCVVSVLAYDLCVFVCVLSVRVFEF